MYVLSPSKSPGSMIYEVWDQIWAIIDREKIQTGVVEGIYIGINTTFLKTLLEFLDLSLF